MKRTIITRTLALVLTLVMVCGLFVGCAKKDDGPITLTVFSQLANWSGEQTGWMKQMLKEKFNVILNIVPSTDGVYETRMESGFLGDIVVFGGDGEDYTRAVKAGMLYDWNEDDLLAEYGPYIKENMQAALEKNAKLNESVNGEHVVYGFGHDVAGSSSDHASFFYTWDIRWDLYKQLGYPEVKNMDDLLQVLIQMKEICPVDDNGNETYAVSLWPDWDGDMVMYVKAFATAYWGYDESAGLGLYDPDTGTLHPTLEENGPYLTALKFFNKLYQNDLVDPNSMSQTFDNMSEKLSAGGVFFSIFNYSGSLTYNSDDHLAEGKMMCSLVPTEASPIVYGMSTYGSNRIWSIGAGTEYPEKCMEIINWLCTPEGVMTYHYGPKDLCWYYDEDGNTHWTEFGQKAYFDKRNTMMIGDYEGTGDFNSGCLQINNTTWSFDAFNPDSNGERFNYKYWRSYLATSAGPIEDDWREHVGFSTIEDYMKSGNYVVAPATTFTLASREGEFKTTWAAVTDVIVKYSWRALYAKDDAQFDQLVSEMIAEAKSYGYDQCIDWSLEQANLRHQLEEEVRNLD